MAVTLGSTGITFPDATTQTTAATAGSPSAMVFINSVTPTAVTNIDTFNASFSSSYSTYLIVGEYLAGSADAGIRMRFVNSGTVDTGTNYSELSGASSIDGNTNRNYAYTDTTTLGSVKSTGTTTKGTSFYAWLHKPNGTNPAYFNSNFQVPNSDTAYNSNGIAGAYIGTATSGIRIYVSSGTFAAQGKIYLYGIKTT